MTIDTGRMHEPAFVDGLPNMPLQLDDKGHALAQRRIERPERAAVGESVSKTQIAGMPRIAVFADALALARRVHGRVAIRETRSHLAVRLFVAALGLAVREARRDPEALSTECLKLGIRATRLEVRVARLAAGRGRFHRGDLSGYGMQDQVARWANCAAYVAHPPNGDPPPATWREAVRYINRRGGVRRLSDLYARRGSLELPDQSALQAGHYDMAGENSTCEWYTPRYVFDCLDCAFDLDPASPGMRIVPWIPAKHHFTRHGLQREWFGFVWLNPPYGREELYKWTEKFAEHKNGICLVPERTSTMWWQYLAAEADLILCMRDRVKFSNAFGEPLGAFPIGTHLFAIGERGVHGLTAGHRNGLGVLMKPFRL